MFSRLWGLIKAHPFIAVGIIVLVVILVRLVVRRGAPADTGYPPMVATGPDAASVAAATAMQAAQLEAQTQIGLANVQLEALRVQSGADFQRAQMEGQVAYSIAELNAGLESQRIAADRATAEQVSALQAGIQQAGIAAQLELAQINATSAKDYYALMLEQSKIQASTAKAAIKASKPEPKTFLQSRAEAGFPLLRTGLSILGGFLLSDARAKTAIRHVGATIDGTPIYTFRYKGGRTTHMGVLAQEAPSRAVRNIGGILAVDYGAL